MIDFSLVFIMHVTRVDNLVTFFFLGINNTICRF